MPLQNFFVQCTCSFDVRMDYLEQKRTCPKCGREVIIAEAIKEYLRSTYSVHELVSIRKHV